MLGAVKRALTTNSAERGRAGGVDLALGHFQLPTVHPFKVITKLTLKLTTNRRNESLL